MPMLLWHVPSRNSSQDSALEVTLNYSHVQKTGLRTNCLYLKYRGLRHGRRRMFILS